MSWNVARHGEASHEGKDFKGPSSGSAGGRGARGNTKWLVVVVVRGVLRHVRRLASWAARAPPV
eukprot:5716207-Prymnesium_polylepis.1